MISRAATLLSITLNSAEIENSMITPALASAGDLLQSATFFGVDYTDLGDVLRSADSVVSAAPSSNISSKLLSTIQSYSPIVSAQIVPGQVVENILYNFRTSTASLDKSATNITVPASALEQLQSLVASSVHFRQNVSSIEMLN